MKNPLKSLGSTLLGIAPALANAVLPGVGGVIAGSAIRAISSALEIEAPDPKDRQAVQRLSDVLSGGLSPEQMAALQRADQEFEVRLKELDVDVTRIHQKDRDSARRMQVLTRSWIMPALAALAMAAFIASIVGVFHLATDDQPLDPTVATLVGAIVGYASAKADQVISFFFGSSEGGDAAAQHLADVAKNGGRA